MEYSNMDIRNRESKQELWVQALCEFISGYIKTLKSIKFKITIFQSLVV